MTRLTITLSDERHRALKEAAAHRNISIRQIVEESIDAYGIKTTDKTAALVGAAGERSGLSEADALALAVEETRLARRLGLIEPCGRGYSTTGPAATDGIDYARRPGAAGGATS